MAEGRSRSLSIRDPAIAQHFEFFSWTGRQRGNRNSGVRIYQRRARAAITRTSRLSTVAALHHVNRPHPVIA